MWHVSFSQVRDPTRMAISVWALNAEAAVAECKKRYPLAIQITAKYVAISEGS
jgi:hypothetical protein